MRAIASRLADLERRCGALRRGGRIYLVTGGATGEDAAAFLANLGVEVGPTDTVVQRVIVAPTDVGPGVVPVPMVLR